MLTEFEARPSPDGDKLLVVGLIQEGTGADEREKRVELWDLPTKWLLRQSTIKRRNPGAGVDDLIVGYDREYVSVARRGSPGTKAVVATEHWAWADGALAPP